jgi:hypothetical protein
MILRPVKNLTIIRTKRDALPRAVNRESSANPLQLHTCAIYHSGTLASYRQQVISRGTSWDIIELQSHADIADAGRYDVS